MPSSTAHTGPAPIPPKTHQHAWTGDAETEGQPVPAWVKRWSSKLPDKLRTFVSDAAEIGKDAAASPAPAAHVSPEKAYVPPRRAPSESYGLHPSAGAGCSRDELEAERERRLEAERESRRLQSEVWSLKAEVSRLHEMMKRFDASNLESPSEAEAAVDMFLRLAREAHSVGEKMRTAEFEARRGGRYGLPTASPVAPGGGSAAYVSVPPRTRCRKWRERGSGTMNESRHALAVSRPRKRKRSNTAAILACGVLGGSGSGNSSPECPMTPDEPLCAPLEVSHTQIGSCSWTAVLRSSLAVAE